MAKAIHWPARYHEEVLAEETTREHCALRLGTLYYEHQYWVPEETVDIRVDHRKVRQAVITQPLRCLPLNALTPTDFSGLKSDLKTVEQVRTFLEATYQQPVSEETVVTLVAYRNLPVNSNLLESED